MFLILQCSYNCFEVRKGSELESCFFGWEFVDYIFGFLLEVFIFIAFDNCLRGF